MSSAHYRPKVLFIMHMPPPVHGASMVGKWIHDSEYIKERFDCYYINLTTARGMSDIGKFQLDKFLAFIRLYKTVEAVVRQTDPDLVYITPNAAGGPFIKDSVIVGKVKRMGYNVLAHFHNKGVSLYEHKPIFRWMYRRFFDRLKVLLIVPSLYDDVQGFVSRKDVYFCPNGTPLTLSREIQAERHNDVPEILFLSNMIISKGVLVLLDALKLLHDGQYSFHCTLLGAETQELNKGKIQQEVDSRGLTAMVDYVGARYGAEKDGFLRKADMMVFPTYYDKECFPLVILEAMEYKLPVVSTYEAGIPYSVIDGQTGLLCNSQNPQELSEKLAMLVDDPQLRWQMGKAGYRLRKEEFSLTTFEKNFADVLSQAITDFREK